MKKKIIVIVCIIVILIIGYSVIPKKKDDGNAKDVLVLNTSNTEFKGLIGNKKYNPYTVKTIDEGTEDVIYNINIDKCNLTPKEEEELAKEAFNKVKGKAIIQLNVFENMNPNNENFYGFYKEGLDYKYLITKDGTGRSINFEKIHEEKGVNQEYTVVKQENLGSMKAIKVTMNANKKIDKQTIEAANGLEYLVYIKSKNLDENINGVDTITSKNTGVLAEQGFDNVVGEYTTFKA